MPKEPQSYGSQNDWVTGKTDQNVNDPKSEPAPEHRDFYEGRNNDDDEPTLKKPLDNSR